MKKIYEIDGEGNLHIRGDLNHSAYKWTLEPKDVNILNEEIITHSNFERLKHGYRGEARVVVTIEIDDVKMTCEKVISLSFKAAK